MISVMLPDGSAKQLSDGASAADLAKSISDGLARVAVAAKVNDAVVDLQRPLPDGAKVQILTKKDAEAVEVLRHSAAHLMADAILRIFPKAQLTIGPVVEDGFYYDIYLPDPKITPDDFPKIEAEMAKIVKQGHPFVRCVSSYDEANEHYQRYKAIDGGHNKFKAELVEGIKQRGEELSFYKHGDFIDLCRGPHVPDTGWLKFVKLTKVAGSYWRADAEKEQLQRVYGTAFFSKAELEDYFKFLEEARKRDHRVLGEQLELFFMDEDAPGFPFFYPKGAMVWNLLVDFMRSNLRRRGYKEVKTPLVLSESMWHTSGHYANYMENMFFTKMKLRDERDPGKINENVEEERPMAVKPMNCPGHLMLYRTRLHSHNEFPLRFAEMGLVHRRELSGVRHGLFRVQAFTQDDAHHFCTPEQIKGEIGMLIDFFHEIYGAFDLTDVRIELSTRPEKSIGSDEVWEKAESALKETLEEKGIEYQLNEGDGAFYGPKIDFHIRDCLNRSWQCGTIQLDFSMPARFGLVYIGADGQRHTPVMIHRACYGSVERFMGVLIEHFAGAFPLWLAPVQVVIVPSSEKYEKYADSIYGELIAVGLRAELNDSNETVGFKMRQAALQKIPYTLIVGENEERNQTVSVHSRDTGKTREMTVRGFLSDLEEWSKDDEGRRERLIDARGARVVYEVKFDFPPIGFAVNSAEPGQKIEVEGRGFVTASDERKLVTILEEVTRGYLDRTLAAMKIPVSAVSSCLIVIGKKSATVHINPQLVARAKVKRAVAAGENVFKHDIADIEAISVQGVHVPADCGVIFVVRPRWRAGVYFDLLPLHPKGQPRTDVLERQFADLWNQTEFFDLFNADREVIQAMFRDGWFPFSFIVPSPFDRLYNAYAEKMEPVAIESKVMESLTEEVLLRWTKAWKHNEHFKPHIQAIEHGVAEYLEGDYLSAISLIMPKVEGVMRSVFRERPGKPTSSGMAMRLEEKLSAGRPGSTLFLPQMLREYLEATFFRKFDEASGDIPFSRHSVAHGICGSEHFNQRSATQILLLLQHIGMGI